MLGYIDRLVEAPARSFDGVFSSSDYPGATATAAVATRLGLPGSDPERVLRASHKYYSRIAQREAVPDATADFRLLVPGQPVPEDLGFPCFVKPVKGAFSVLSGRMDSAARLAAFISAPVAREFLDEYLTMFHRLVHAYSDFEVDGRAFLAEEYLPGRQATVEGYVGTDEPRALGVVESIFHPDMPSFARFELPTAFPREIEARMSEIAVRVIAHLGLRHTMFNVEMNWDPGTDRIHIIEINPRMAGQFADLYEKVTGVNGYELALSLAAGRKPDMAAGGGAFGAAASVPLRIFEPSRVVATPTDERVAEVEERFPGTLVWRECHTGDELAAFEAEDGHSCRYAVVNLGADSRAELLERLAGIEEALGYEFEPL